MQLSKRLGKDHPKENAADHELFVSRYFASTSRADLSVRGDDSMYDNLDQAWSFYQQRGSKPQRSSFCISIRELNGLRSGTRILVLQKDMPFLGRLDAAGTSALLRNH